MPESAKEKILSLHCLGMSLGLGRMEEACRKSGMQQRKFTSIHVCGTVGKGSVTAMTASILREAGYSVGEYYSPHIRGYDERIQVDGKKISDGEIEKLYPKIASLHLPLTFFEFTTVLAFLYYAQKRCDFAVLEAGLGGRLDATRAASGKYCIITRIGFDHAHILGKTLRKIAREKCGIVREGATVITIGQEKEAMKVIQEECKRRNAKLIVARKLPAGIKLGLRGAFQKENASLAYAFAKEIGIGEKNIRKGLEDAFIPGRMETVHEKPRMIIDSAHNSDGIKALVAEVRKMRCRRLIVLFSAMKDKEYAGEMLALGKIADVFICTKVSLERGEGLERLYLEAKKHCRVAIGVRNPAVALEIARKMAGKDDLILITGSMYLISELFGKDTVGM